MARKMSELKMLSLLNFNGKHVAPLWFLNEIYQGRNPVGSITDLDTGETVEIDITKKDISIIYFCEGCSQKMSSESCYECRTSRHVIELPVLRKKMKSLSEQKQFSN
ncbi:hypothetical protein ERICIV_04606 (plasmid) [Paenibacillus larvae subsp. larvae]|uniref:Uncharacterized protein n=2 Tax=Paenibacillus larvae TaxID=1464 RepID=A0A2L1UKB0_9BACL|nr:hypothetical protein [Paenibacillus larvae]AQT87027.1 hypothetical protein B1222_23640 [Paenibacillus larvae subsp. pulvifaciens]AQZ49343.1 hypothetical protein B5S25_22840 [Paenibacillus larvae subsp. pulvifaciens]AVF28988.1 hypothetical protein ERICIII_04987 [Paenibacillus larvae subsp. larvae]AVF33369.1 hypothetical protein ERICIV_04606 [Paenibacillus larvae subsp. larvae]MBH0342395.1 hypothetical protein [Paenibacillus larvae]